VAHSHSFLGKVHFSHRPPMRRPNLETRVREHLLPDEVEALIVAARKTRYPERNSTLILTMFRHGLRVAEAACLRWVQIDQRSGLMHVNRLKAGTSATHPISARESRALHALRKISHSSDSWVFRSERGGPMSCRNIHAIVAAAGEKAGLEFPCHPHQLRHACGYYLALQGQDTRAIQAYLGHTSIEHTVRYTALAPDRFKNFWKD
jgi:type 1 fimbriae regulatory protein FimB/type 1 fimbriae regulatory protein FimE